jgi:hypothetical protein
MRCMLTRPVSGTRCHATPSIWEPPLPPPRPQGELRLLRFFTQISSAPPLRLPVLQALATTSADHRSSSLTPGTPLSHTAASVRPHWYHLTRHFPLFALELPPPVPPHLVARLDAGSHATVGVPCALTTRCARHVTSTGRLGHPSALGHRAGQAAAPIRPEALGQFQPNTVPGFLNRFSLF